VLLLRRRALTFAGALAALPWPAGAASHGAAAAARPVQTVLPRAVQELIESTGLPATSFGLHVQPVGAGAGRPGPALVALNAESTFQMASTVKLVTALAALDLLGPAYRWHTCVCLCGPLREGRLLGDLVIVGGGDPCLQAGKLQAWLAELRARGLHEVWGDIVLDRSAFQLRESDHLQTPQPAPDQPGYVRPEALMLDAGVLRIGLQGDAAQTRVQVRPRQAGLPVINQLTPGRQCQAAAELERTATDARLVVKGQWAPGCGEREIAQLAVSHSDLTTRAVADLWRGVGGRLKGRVRAAAAAAPAEADEATSDASYSRSAPWASLASPPLTELMQTMNKVSDNLIARTLFLSLAEDFPHRAATLPAARARAAAWLRGRGFGEGDIAVDNGAGLAYSERCRPRAMVRLLQQAWQGPHAKEFVASLPVAGVDGTLWRRMTSGPARGRAYLKTGSGIETRTLAGYVRCRSGRVQAVAALVNHAQVAAAVPALDALVEWVVLNG
jgi:D-alanyl-D-alanine carboxypeptidase/D-alanyl-D-alanine-endopeptidase (penicillin-binding protein 4)